ncbi:hypothetical protein R2B67_01040 [Streptomyces cyaneofuscatus]|uniref:hypothetical protein n=1 Tax=Streptomyces cyaneofuscatus TaxID=66883 RepID=UPI00295405E5|nr:hypothetical protein [Streptomyces cyaneofuscatus]WOP07199.1 hypothetical protein R2B67_01040 [Streptomyces cyaneofuscatus]
MAAAAVALTMLGAPSARAEGRGDIRTIKRVVDGGTNVIVGVSKPVTFPIRMTVKDNSGVRGVDRVSTFSTHNRGGPVEWIDTSCVKKSKTTSDCTATMYVDPKAMPHVSDRDPDKIAGQWQVNANDKDYWISDRIALYQFKRAATLTTDAAPEPGSNGKKLTVKGKLSRSSWKDLEYHGFGGQKVTLQFRKAGATSYKNVATVKSSASGNLRAAVTASAAGTWRWYFAGTGTTMKVISAGDSVKLG